MLIIWSRMAVGSVSNINATALRLGRLEQRSATEEDRQHAEAAGSGKKPDRDWGGGGGRAEGAQVRASTPPPPSPTPLLASASQAFLKRSPRLLNRGKWGWVEYGSPKRQRPDGLANGSFPT